MSEFILPLANGNTLRTSSYEANPGGADYVAVCLPDGREVVRWTSDEWRDDPELVMGAIFGAAASASEDDLS